MRFKADNRTRDSGHETVAELMSLKTPEPSLRVDFTDQKISGRAGLLTFAGFPHWHGFNKNCCPKWRFIDANWRWVQAPVK
jgi:hypothetical protein